MRGSSSQNIWQSVPFWALSAFLAITFWLGGSARPDVESLLILRPAAAVVLAIGLLGLRLDHVRAYAALFGFGATIFGLIVAHLIPLPPLIWHSFPGHDIVRQVDAAATLGDVWRPLSLVPLGTWNALFALLVPLTVLVLMVQLSRDQRFRLLNVLLILAGLSGLVGFLQILGAGDGPLYFYAITNNGAAVGLFANRNHQAVLLATVFPMLAFFASVGIKSVEQARFRGWIALGGGMVLVPLILITGSRAGLLVGVVGLLGAALLYRQPTIAAPAKRVVKRTRQRLAVGGIAILALGFVTLLMARAEAIQRLLQTDAASDGRWPMWVVGWSMAWKYFPLGAGFGAITQAFDIDEPQALLGPTYTNHLHNDWLELLVCGGLPALILLGLALFGWARKTLALAGLGRNASREVAFARLGACVMLMLALASVADYPLRVPSLSCLFVIAAVWLANPSDRVGDKSVHAAISDGNG